MTINIFYLKIYKNNFLIFLKFIFNFITLNPLKILIENKKIKILIKKQV